MTDLTNAPPLPDEPQRYDEDGHEAPNGVLVFYSDWQALRAQLSAETARADACEKKAAALWALLDDIDTASDIFKADYEALAKYTYRKQRRRFEFMSAEEWERLTPIDAALGAPT